MQRDRHVVRLLSVREVGVQVGDIDAVELQQPDGLAGAGESRPRNRPPACRCLEKRPRVRNPWWLRALHPSFLCTRAGCGIEKLSKPEICHSGNRRGHGGLPVRSIEGAILRGVLVDAHAHIKGCLNDRHRALDLHVHAVAGAAHHLEAAALLRKPTTAS